MRQRQDEILLPRIQHPERQIVVVILAEKGIAADVAQAVVHPAHVPLEAETQAAQMVRA